MFKEISSDKFEDAPHNFSKKMEAESFEKHYYTYLTVY